MSDVIKEALKIDKNARDQLEELQKKKDSIHEDVNAKRKKIEAKYEKEVEGWILEYVKKQEEELVLLQKENAEKVLKGKEKLQKHYEDHKDEWIETIFKSVVG